MQPRYVAGSLLIAASLGFLIASSMKAGTLKSVPVADLRAKDNLPDSFVGQHLRVVGFVGNDPVKKTGQETPEGLVSVSNFDVVEGKAVLSVSYSDTLPDTFRCGGPVQIDGLYVAPGVMQADHVLTKCPSKYEAGQSVLKQYSKTPAQGAQPASM